MNRGLKKRHLPPGKESLEVRCLRDGTLDCCLETGRVFSVRNGRRLKRKLRADADGYLGFTLNRERKDRRGKPDRDGRHRERRYVLVNRLVKIKAIAVGVGGQHWRDFVRDLPRGIDVNHIDAVRHNNRATNLELLTEKVNRMRDERMRMSEEEYAAIGHCGF